MTDRIPPTAPDPRLFIQTNLPLRPVPGLDSIRLHTAHPGSGLRRLVGSSRGTTPYWAYPWAGGSVLARFFLDRPETVSGRRVLDLGAGGGIVGIAALKAGASNVLAAETDRLALESLSLNAAANGVSIETLADDLLDASLPAVDLVAVGDLFYEKRLARRVTAFLDRCAGAGIEVFVGDPGRAHLPRARLQWLADYSVLDFGEAAASQPSSVYLFVDRAVPAVTGLIDVLGADADDKPYRSTLCQD